MKRNIIATIKFSSGKVNITILEKLASNMVEIFNMSTGAKHTNVFIEESLNQIETLIGARLKKVSVVVEPTAKTQTKTVLHKESISIAGAVVSKTDIINVIKLSKNSFESIDRRVILVQPIKFDVFDVMTKSYNRAPIDKKGNKLTVTSAITTIAGETYDFIKQVIKSQGLEITQILLTPQVISQNNLSSTALQDGSILIHIGTNQSFITINKNLSTIASMSIYGFGYNNLVSGVSKVFGCSKKDAIDLLAVHGTLDVAKNNRVIFSRQEGIEEKIYYAYELQAIINSFISKLLMVSQKFVDQKNVGKLPIVISGKLGEINQLELIARQYLSTDHVSSYSPLSFIEMNKENIEAIGMSKFMGRMDAIMGRKYNTIVETNPDSILMLKKQKSSKKWFAKFTDKIGGKYEWN